MPLIVLTKENRAVVTRKTMISLGFRRLLRGPYRARPYALPMLAISKLRDGGMQNCADVACLLGVADAGELVDVRALAADQGTEFVEDIENLLIIGNLEDEMRWNR